MPEYKELERALLARMLRAGVIDAATFTERVIALGYSPDDTILMLRLEQAEAVKTRLRSRDWFSFRWRFDEPRHQERLSDPVDVEGSSYLILSNSAYVAGETKYMYGIRFYDAAGDVIATVWDNPAGEKRFGQDKWITETFTFPLPEGAITARIVINLYRTAGPSAYIEYVMLFLDGVKL